MQPFRDLCNQISVKATRSQSIVTEEFYFKNFSKRARETIDLENSLIKLHLRKIRGYHKPYSNFKTLEKMFWTLELASYLEDAPWPATKDELIDYSIRSGAPIEVVENLQELEDEGDVYETIEDIWPDYPTQDDFLFNEDEY
jgi:hypothetical protein